MFIRRGSAIGSREGGRTQMRWIADRKLPPRRVETGFSNPPIDHGFIADFAGIWASPGKRSEWMRKPPGFPRQRRARAFRLRMELLRGACVAPSLNA
jgi:hypothetical protein